MNQIHLEHHCHSRGHLVPFYSSSSFSLAFSLCYFSFLLFTIISFRLLLTSHSLRSQLCMFSSLDHSLSLLRVPPFPSSFHTIFCFLQIPAASSSSLCFPCGQIPHLFFFFFCILLHFFSLTLVFYLFFIPLSVQHQGNFVTPVACNYIPLV